MASKRQRLKLTKRLSKLDIVNNKNVDLPENDCTIIDDGEFKQNEESYRIKTAPIIKDERLVKLWRNLENVCQKFPSSSLVPFPSLEVNNLKESLNEKSRINSPQWTPFPSTCIECATNTILLPVENTQAGLLDRSIGTSSLSQGVVSLFSSSFQSDDQSPKPCDKENPFQSESPNKMEVDEISSSPDLFGQISSENQKCQSTKSRTVKDSNAVSTSLFPDVSGNSQNKETHSKRKPIRSCPLCQENFPTQMSQLEMDEHIAGCLNDADDDINW